MFGNLSLIRKVTMTFSFEVPLKYLKLFYPRQDFVFCLSYLFEHKEYARFVSEVKEKQVIIDNSFNELSEPSSVDGLVILSRMYPSAIIVSPDNPDWGIMKQIGKAIELRARLANSKAVLAPINSPSWAGYYRSRGFYNLTMGYGLRTLSDPDLQLLNSMHFLGLNSIRELFVGCPASCDTGLPIKLAKQGMTVEDWVSQDCPHDQLGTDFFNWKLSPIEIVIAQENMDKLKLIGRMIPYV